MDQYYIEEGYVETAYFERIVDSGVISLEPYFAEDYTETGYVLQRGSEFNLIAIPHDGQTVEIESVTFVAAGFLVVAIGKLVEVPPIYTGQTVTMQSVTFSSAATMTIAVGKIVESTISIDSAMSATMTAVAYKNHDASLDSAFTMTVDVNVQTDTTGLLEYFADLNAQAARSRETSATMAADIQTNIDVNATLATASILTSDFGIVASAARSRKADASISAKFFTSNNSADIGRNIEANATLDAASILTSAFSITSTAEIIIYGEADLNSAFTATTTAIEYIKKSDLPASSTARPRATKYISQDISGEDVPVFDSNTKFLGSHSLRFYNSTAQNSYVTYYADDTTARLPSTGDSFHLEAWIRAFDAPLVTIRNGANDVQLSLYANNGNQIVVRYRTGTNSFRTISGSFSTSAHVVVKAEDGVIKLYINGSLAETSTVPYSGRNINEIVIGDDDTLGGFDTQGYAYIDELRIIKGSIAAVASEVGYAFSSTTATVPTEEYSSTASTQLLLHFNNSYDDDIYGVQTAESTLPSAFTQTATLSGSAFIQAALSSAFTATVDATNIKETSADFNVVASQLSAAGKVGDFFVNADITATLEVSEDLFKGATGELTLQATIQANAVKSVEAGADLTGVFTPTLIANANKLVDIDLVSTTQLVADAGRILETNMAVAVASALVANGGLITDININITTATGFVASGFVKVFNLDQYVYTIPAESRTHSITRETRSDSITKDHRIYTIEGT
jgi:hypothetical protein